MTRDSTFRIYGTLTWDTDERIVGVFSHLKAYALKSGWCVPFCSGAFSWWWHLSVWEWRFPSDCYVLFADLCDHALHISHDELWTTGAAQTDRLDGPPPGGEEGGNAFYIMFLLKWTEKLWSQKYELCCLFMPRIGPHIRLENRAFQTKERKEELWEWCSMKVGGPWSFHSFVIWDFCWTHKLDNHLFSAYSIQYV